MTVTLHQLRIFWAVAHTRSLTKASKLLDLAQPSISQQIAKMEEIAGVQLFDRSHSKLDLTDAGQFLLHKAQDVLAGMDEAMAGLAEFNDGTRGVISIGALNSIARALLPGAITRMTAERFPHLEFDVHEVAPAEAIELLYARRLTVALIASGSVAASTMSFFQADVIADPYVLAVPRSLDLSGVRDPARNLTDTQRAILNNSIQFSFGTQHTLLMEEWYRRILPQHRVVAQTRTYEMALSLVQGGVGVAVLPALTARLAQDSHFDVSLYRTDLTERRVVALMPSQYARIEPYASFVTALQETAREIRMPPIEASPPFMTLASQGALA